MPCALPIRSEEHTSELQSHDNLVCRLLLEKNKSSVVDGRRVVVPVGEQQRTSPSIHPHVPLDGLPHPPMPVVNANCRYLLCFFFFYSGPHDAPPLPPPADLRV